MKNDAEKNRKIENETSEGKPEDEPHDVTKVDWDYIDPDMLRPISGDCLFLL